MLGLWRGGVVDEMAFISGIGEYLGGGGQVSVMEAHDGNRLPGDLISIGEYLSRGNNCR